MRTVSIGLLAFIVASLLLGTATPLFAEVPSAVFPDAGVDVSDYLFELFAYEPDYATDFGSPNSANYAQAASNTVFDITTQDLSLWGTFNRASDTGAEEDVVRKMGGGSTAGYAVIITSGDQLQGILRDGTDTASTAASGITVSTGVDYAWGFSSNSTHINLWLYNLSTDAIVAKNAASSAVDSATNTNTFTVGRSSAGSSSFFPGSMDDVNVLDGTAITQAQFVEFAQTVEIDGVTSTSTYDFNDGSGSTVDDAVGSNDLTLFGTPTWLFQQSRPMLKFATNFYADEVLIHGSHVNFTTTAIGGASNTARSFGLGAEGGNATLSAITGDRTLLTMTCITGLDCDAYYYYTEDVPVYAVQTSVGATTTMIQPGSFYTNFALFEDASMPAVYSNTTGNYLQARINYTSPSSVAFFTGTYIYADLGTAKLVENVRVIKSDATAIPASVNIYATNDLTDWGAPIASNIALTQQVGSQTINIPDTTARYFKLEVNVFGEADSVKLGTYDFEINSYDEDINQEAQDAAEATETNFYLVITIASFGSVFTVLMVLFNRNDWFDY